MKPYGCTSEYADQRKSDLLRAYRTYISNCRLIEKAKALDEIVNMPASRFYISRQRAYSVVIAILTGKDNLSTMRPNKRDMFVEIYNRTMVMHEQYPDMPLVDIVDQVIAQPAPRFYLSSGSAKTIINEAKKEWSRNHMRRMLIWR
jgi:hypothetical protein